MLSPVDPNAWPGPEDMYPAPDPRGRRPRAWVMVVMVFGALAAMMGIYALLQTLLD